MLLGFKRQFAPFVEDGSKTHTIRSVRKIAPRVGETCHCYVDPRQKSMRLLGRWPCVRVEQIEIVGGYGGIAQILVEGTSLDLKEMEALARRDGFRDGGLKEMEAFWAKTHGLAPSYIFRGQIIHWKFPEARP
jgi:hypothetical protein